MHFIPHQVHISIGVVSLQLPNPAKPLYPNLVLGLQETVTCLLVSMETLLDVNGGSGFGAGGNPSVCI